MINAIRKLINGEQTFNKINTAELSISGLPIITESGKVFWLKKEADTDFVDFYNAHNVFYEGNKASVYTTVDAVFAAAGKHDTIIIMPPDSGGHDMTTTITIGASQYGLKVFGTGNTMYGQRTMLKMPSTVTAADMFLIKTDKVEIAGLTFQQRTAKSCIVIGDTAGQAYYQIYIHDCNFTDYGAAALYGITPGAVAGADSDQADTVNLVVEKCYFDGFVTAAIKSNGTRDAYVDNYIKVAATAIGIHIFKHTDSRGGGLYKGNYMIGPVDATTMGITVTDVGSTAFANNIVDNYFVGFTTAAQPITKQTNQQGGGNWYAAAADGTWTNIDIVT